MARSRQASLAELRDECAKVKAAAEPDLEARRQAIHRGRYLRSYPDVDGGWNLRVRDNPEVGAQIMAAIAPIADRLFENARAKGRREPPEAYAADALAELAAASIAGPVGPTPASRGALMKVIVRVDLAALLRGYPIEGETSDIVGFGPIAVSAIRDMIDTGNPFLAAIATRGKQVLGVAHLGRRPNAHQTTALQWLYPACTVLGCPTQAHLEIDHRVDWADSHITMLDWLDALCKPHHRLKTQEGWALVEGTGKRPIVPRDDPRHPRHQTKQRPPPAVDANRQPTPHGPRTHAMVTGRARLETRGACNLS